ncbi:OmpA family protein [Hallella bergensis]|uniref:OmpA family protein n=1 Tax=Hallella bergensis TaxID=242750 RepID=UPI003990CDE8
MKKFKKMFMAVALLSMSVVTAFAQATYTDADNNEYQFKKHAFLNLQGGAQYTLGEAKFDKLISPNVQLGIGYQFSPVFALRLQANGWQSKGGWNGYELARTGNPYTADYKFNYVAPGLDLMFNLSNLFCGWNPNRVFNVTAFLGGGANVAWKNDEVNAIAATLQKLDNYQLQNLWDGTKVNPFGRAGLELGFRISDAVSFVVEGNANILTDKYNSKKADNPDWYFNALAGLRINLGKSYTKKETKPEPAPEPTHEYVAPTPTPTPAPEPTPEPVAKKIEPIRRDVFFTINKYAIRAAEQSKIDEIVSFLKENPDATVSVTGYADAGTGNNTINDRLAAQRAASVVKAIKDKGISANRIKSDSKGARVQPFAENNKNRVSIMIAE